MDSSGSCNKLSKKSATNICMVCKVQRNYGNIKLPMLFVVGEDDANAPSDTVITSYRMTPYAD